MAGTTTLSTLTASLPSFPTSAEIAENLRQAVGGLNSLITNYNVGGVSQTYLEAVAIALGSDASTLPNSTVEGAYEILASIMRAAYIATASGIYLDLKCLDVGVTRKGATYANTDIQFVLPTAAPVGGSTVAAGAIVSAEPADPTQGPIMFITLADATIAAGGTLSSAVGALAVNAGSAGNCPANTISTIQSGGGTAQSCYNPAKAGGGADTEGDDAPNGGLRARGLAAILNASQCTVAAIALAARAYTGIISATVADNTALTLNGVVLAPAADPSTGNGTTFLRGSVLVYCDDGSGNLGDAATNADGTFVEANHSALVAFNRDLTAGLWRAAGVTAVAIGSETLATTAALSIDVAASYVTLGNTAASVATAAQAAVYGWINALPLGAPVTLAGIVQTAIAVDGVSNVLVATVTINGAAADLIAQPQQVARCVNAPTDVTVTVNATTAYA